MKVAEDVETTTKKNWVSILIRGVMALVLILLLLLALLHVPVIQRIITNTIINQVSKNIEADISIVDSSFDIMNGVVVKKVLITKTDGDLIDTLAHVNHISISPRGTLISLIRGGLNFNDLQIEGVDIRLQRKAQEEFNNWERALRLNEPKKESISEGLPAFLSYLRVDDLSFFMNDEKEGKRIEAKVRSMEVAMDEIDFSDSTFILIDRLILVDPVIKIHSNVGNSKKKPVTEGEVAADLNTYLNIDVKELSIINGNVKVVAKGKDDLVLSSLTLLVKKVNYNGLDDWELTLHNAALSYKKDQLRYFSAGKISQKNKQLTLSKLQVRVNDSYLKLDAKVANVLSGMNFSKASYSVDLSPSKIFIKDLRRIFPDQTKELGRDKITELPIQIGGKYVWDNGMLTANDISVWIGREHHFDGDLLFEKGKTLSNSIVNVEVKHLKSNIYKLNELSSKFNFPPIIMRMGDINFSGSYDGYVSDFIANGHLTTSLGNADMDIQFDLSGEGDKAITYEGLLILDEFDLAGFMNNEDFGFVDARVDITNGIGADLSSSTADLKAVISKIIFKEYEYKDAIYEGQLSSSVINGKFEIEDPNVDLTFEGIVDLSNKIPLFDFNILANKINLCNLNIANFPCQVSFASDISFRGNSLSTMEGRGSIGDIDLIQDSTSLHIENINIRSARIQKGMQIEVVSDFVDFNIAGQFNLIKLFDHTVDQMLSNTSKHNDTWKFKRLPDTLAQQKFSYALYLKELTPALKFLGLDIEERGKGVVTGILDTELDQVELKGFVPYLRYGDMESDSIRIDMQSSPDELDLVVRLQNVIRGNTKVQEASVTANIHDEILDWTLFGLTKNRDEVSITAQSLAEKEGYFTKITGHNIFIDSNKWYFLPNDGFGIYPNEIDFDDLTLTDGEVYVSLDDNAGRGLKVGLNDFQLGFINPIINYDKLEFSGKVNSTFKVVDVFNDRSILGYLNVEDFLINGDDFGILNLKAQRGDRGVVDIDLAIEKDTQNLYAVGYADIENEFVNVDITLEDYPMQFFEYIIDEGISETEGTTDITAKLHGPLSDLKMSATGLIKNAGVRVDFLGAFYRMEDQTVKLNESFIDFSDVQLIDEMGNTAQVNGGLKHNLLADIEAELSISSPRFIGLNTTIEDNPLYYGLGVGKLDIDFLGPFDAIDIRVNAVVGRLSQLYIPITSIEYVYEESFIRYNYEKTDVDTTNAISLVDILKDQGADFEMNLTFTPEALVSVIYDETTSNVLNGRGEGDMRIRVKRDGEFTVHGDYTVTSGDYLFTSYGVIAKQFLIRPGGTVKWTGDPVNASITLIAEYPGLRPTMRNFLLEYSSFLEDGILDQRHDVDLTLLLGGTLYQPDIDFNLEFPNLVGPVRTYAQSKLRTLKASENGINNQVVGLMVFGDFLPENDAFGGASIGTIGETAASTVSQFITSQLSLFLSDYLSKQLDEEGFITGIDLQIAMANNSFNNTNDGTLFDEVQVNMRNRIKNGNLYVNVGGNYVRQSQYGTNDNYVTGDLSIDWFLTEDHRLKLRFYSNIGFDEARSTGRQKYGLGISYRKEFGAITDFEAVLNDLVHGVNKEIENR
ncbi:MAG: hypothetical protein ACJA01_002588 [Saprospiraceae bacterium]